MIRILTLLLALSSTARADPQWSNAFDQKVGDALRLESPEARERVANASDYALIAAQVASLTYIGVDSKDMGKVGVAAGMLAANALVNQVVKRVAQRERPNKRDRHSFFSGHASGASGPAGAVCAYKANFMCAALIVNAVGVGGARIASGWHHPTDVLVGLPEGFYGVKFLVQLTREF